LLAESKYLLTQSRNTLPQKIYVKSLRQTGRRICLIFILATNHNKKDGI